MNLNTLIIAVIVSYVSYSIEATSSVESVELPYAQTGILNCSSLGNSPSWYLNNLTTSQISVITTGGKYTINSDSTLTITDLRSPELTAQFICNSSSGSMTFNPLPRPYMYARDKSSVTVTEGGFTTISCQMIVGFQQNQTIEWTWTLNGVVLTNGGRVAIDSTLGVNNSTSSMTLRQITINDKGTISCTVNNGVPSNATYTQDVTLRVKNTLAALWPFLAIVGEVIILCIIILVFEKKCTKKSTTSEDEAENLMSKQKDNNNNSDLKKRSVKA